MGLSLTLPLNLICTQLFRLVIKKTLYLCGKKWQNAGDMGSIRVHLCFYNCTKVCKNMKIAAMENSHCFLAAFFQCVKYSCLYQLCSYLSQTYSISFLHFMMCSCHCLPLIKNLSSSIYSIFNELYPTSISKCLCSVCHRFSKRCYNKERADIDFSSIVCNVTFSPL